MWWTTKIRPELLKKLLAIAGSGTENIVEAKFDVQPTFDVGFHVGSHRIRKEIIQPTAVNTYLVGPPAGKAWKVRRIYAVLETGTYTFSDLYLRDVNNGGLVMPFHYTGVASTAFYYEFPQDVNLTPGMEIGTYVGVWTVTGNLAVYLNLQEFDVD